MVSHNNGLSTTMTTTFTCLSFIFETRIHILEAKRCMTRPGHPCKVIIAITSSPLPLLDKHTPDTGSTPLKPDLRTNHWLRDDMASSFSTPLRQPQVHSASRTGLILRRQHDQSETIAGIGSDRIGSDRSTSYANLIVGPRVAILGREQPCRDRKSVV